MMDADDIVTALRKASPTMVGTPMDDHYWVCQKAADLIIHLKGQIDDLKKADSRYIGKLERNRTIYLRRKAGERNKDLAQEYGVSEPAISKIVQRERSREREGK